MLFTDTIVSVIVTTGTPKRRLEVRKKVRENMRIERIRKNLTANDAAECIGVHVNAILRWERGEAEPLAENLVSLSKLYGCSPEYLLEHTNDPHGKAVVA